MRKANVKLPDFSFEMELWQKGFQLIAGMDEVGRGAFAGPVVAAAVVFKDDTKERKNVKTKKQSLSLSVFQSLSNDVVINDSKQMRPRERELATNWIKENCLAWGIGEVGPQIINRLGMAKATKMAFRSAIANLKVNLHKRVGSSQVDFLLIDAFFIPYVNGLRKKHQLPIVKGDQKSLSIAAASIIAKVYRDGVMVGLSRKYSKYGWKKNKGYGTREHQEAIKRHGITRLHRRVFVESWKKKISNY